MEEQLIVYVHKALKAGQPLDKIEADLLATGVDKKLAAKIIAGFEQIAQADASPPKLDQPLSPDSETTTLETNPPSSQPAPAKIIKDFAPLPTHLGQQKESSLQPDAKVSSSDAAIATEGIAPSANAPQSGEANEIPASPQPSSPNAETKPAHAKIFAATPAAHQMPDSNAPTPPSDLKGDRQTSPPPRQTIKTKIIALWFVLGGLGSVIAGVLLFAYAWFLPSNNVFSSTYLLPVRLCSSFLSIASIYCGWLLFKLSDGLHQLQIEAYKTASMLFVLSCIGSAVSILRLFSSLDSSKLLVELFGFGISALLLYLLQSDKSIYHCTTLKKLRLKLIVTLIVLFIASVITMMLTAAARKEIIERSVTSWTDYVQNSDTLGSLNAPEKDIVAWEKYVNNDFGFRFDQPGGWYYQELNISDNSNGPWYIGFDPEPIPSDAYENDVYFHIKIFPKTNTYLYNRFKELLSAAKQETGYGELTALDDEYAVLTSSRVIACEHEDYVYELHLTYQFTEDMHLELSDMSKHIRDSFRFF